MREWEGGGGGERHRTEKCNTLRGNLTIQQENRTGHFGSCRVAEDKKVVSPPPWEKTNFQAHYLPAPAKRGLMGARAPPHLCRDSQQRPRWKQGPGEGSLSRATPRVPDGGSKAGTRGRGAAARDPPFLGSPEPLAALG